jgi:hypothetical protein
MPPKGDVLWVRLPEEYHIEAASEQIPYDHLLDTLEFGEWSLSPWFKAVMGKYTIVDIPSTVIHTCELESLPKGIDPQHTALAHPDLTKSTMMALNC